MITVYQANSTFDAKLIQDLLFHNGIESHIMGGYLQGGVGELQANNLVRLMVGEKDLDYSLTIIEDWRNTEIPEKEKTVTQPAKPTKSNKPVLLFIIVFVIMGFYLLTEL